MLSEADGELTVRLLELGLDEVDRGRADEAGDELVLRLVVEHLRRVDLLQAPGVHHRDAVAHRHRLDLVVRDVDRRHVEPPLELVDLGPHLHAELRVEVREGLVHQERLGLAHDRPAHRDALALAARERARLALQKLVDLEDVGGPLDALRDLLLRHLVELQAEGEVVLDRHVRVERVALEDHRDVPFLRREVVDDAVADPELAVGDLLEPGDHAQGGRLAAPGRADQHHQFAVLDREVEVIHGLRPVVVDLRDAAELDLRQLGPSFQKRAYSATPRCRTLMARGRRRRSMRAATRREISIRSACRAECQAPARLPAAVAHPASESGRLAWHPSWQLQLPRCRSR